jgi:hypothetical protein
MTDYETQFNNTIKMVIGAWSKPEILGLWLERDNMRNQIKELEYDLNVACGFAFDCGRVLYG